MIRSKAGGILLRHVLSSSCHGACGQGMQEVVHAGQACTAGGRSHRLYAALAAAAPAAMGVFALDYSLQPGRSMPSLRLWSSAATPQPQRSKPGEEPVDSLELTEEKMSSITDKIPQRPVGVVEGASYTAIIIAAFAVLAFVLYHVVTSLVLQPTALTCFNHTLDRLKGDPRITVRIGGPDDIRAWGSNSESRVARQQIPHQIYKDATGKEHVRIQFYIKGPSGTGLVNADMYKDASNEWSYTYLLVDVYSGNSQTPQRVHIINPR